MGRQNADHVQILNEGIIMHDTTAIEMPTMGGVCSAAPEAIPVPTTDEPDTSWSNDMLLHCGQRAIEEGDRLESQAQPFIRQSIDSRLSCGHAFSILRARLRAEGRWTVYQ